MFEEEMYIAERSGSTIKEVPCEKCLKLYYYRLSSYEYASCSPFILPCLDHRLEGLSGYQELVDIRATQQLEKSLLYGYAYVKCPHCNALQTYMKKSLKKEVRVHYFKKVATLAMSLLVVILVSKSLSTTEGFILSTSCTLLTGLISLLILHYLITICLIDVDIHDLPVKLQNEIFVGHTEEYLKNAQSESYNKNHKHDEYDNDCEYDNEDDEYENDEYEEYEDKYEEHDEYEYEDEEYEDEENYHSLGK